MALFPRCRFEFLLSSGVLVAGQRNEGSVVLHVPEAIPRAEHVFMVFQSEAWAGYGGGKSRRIVRRPLLHVPFRVDLPEHGMPPGDHSYPFFLDVPPWLPPDLHGNDCGIKHKLAATLDVDWAIDPSSEVHPAVVQPPSQGHRGAAILHSPSGFHDRLVLEITLGTQVIVEGEPLEGQLALRAGADARFDGVVLTLARIETIVMGTGDARRSELGVIRVPARQLLGGEPVAFRFPVVVGTTFTSGHIDSRFALVVEADIPWGFDPEFAIPITVLPRGSEVAGDVQEIALGSERMRQMARYVAARTGLAEGTPPVLVHGRERAVSFTLSDAPRGGSLGVEAMLVHPPLGVDIRMRTLGVLDGFRTSPLLPPELADQLFLRCEVPEGRFEREPLDPRAFHRLLEGLGAADSVRMSDRHLAFHFPVEDDADKLAQIASFVAARARTLSEIHAAMPFPTALLAARPSWEAAAAERGGELVPSGPSIAGISLGVRTLGGEERTFSVQIGTDWDDDAPLTWVDLGLVGFTFPGAAQAQLEGQGTHPLLTSVRGVLPRVTHEGPSALRAHAERFVEDPRSLFPALESLVAWVLDLRGERRVDAPYR